MAPRPMPGSRNGSGGSNRSGSGSAAIATSPARSATPMKRRALPSTGRPPSICRKHRGRSAGSNMARRAWPAEGSILLADLDQTMPDAHPLVEDEAAAVPAAVGLGHLFQIGEDAALQMDDLLDAFVAQESGRFFAADAAGDRKSTRLNSRH